MSKPNMSAAVDSWLATPPPPLTKPKKKEVPEQKDSRNTFVGCSHDYQLIPGEYSQSVCPTCHKPDFRRLKCRHCERPQSDTGSCRGHVSFLR